MAASFTFIAWSLLLYKNAYESSGQLHYAHILLEQAIEYFTKVVVYNSDGSIKRIYVVVGDPDEDEKHWGRPEEMPGPRYGHFINETNPGSEVSADLAAFFSAVSLVVRDDDQELGDILAAQAVKLHEFASKFRSDYERSVDVDVKSYKSWTGYGDELTWSALWLFKATNDSKYFKEALKYFKDFKLERVPQEFSWNDKTPALQVLLYEMTKEEIYATLLEGFCEKFIGVIPKSGSGMFYFDNLSPIRHAMGAAFVFLQAARLGIKTTHYRHLALEQVNLVLGDSATGMSYVIGYGNKYPLRPWHKASSCPDPPAACGWPQFYSKDPNPQILWGALVGGPSIDDRYYDTRTNRRGAVVSLEYNAMLLCVISTVVDLEDRSNKNNSTASSGA